MVNNNRPVGVRETTWGGKPHPASDPSHRRSEGGKQLTLASRTMNNTMSSEYFGAAAAEGRHATFVNEWSRHRVGTRHPDVVG